jgi:glutathione S-transferase
MAEDIYIDTPRLLAKRVHGWSTFPYITALIAQVQLDWTEESKSEKPDGFFAELPSFETNGLSLSQPFAIVRYLAFLGEIQGKDPGSFGRSEMLTEVIRKAYETFITQPQTFSSDILPSLFSQLEANLAGEYFTGSEPVQADAVILAFCYLLQRANSVTFNSILSQTAQLFKWFECMSSLDEFTAAKEFMNSIPYSIE